MSLVRFGATRFHLTYERLWKKTPLENEALVECIGSVQFFGVGMFL
jgi:hypothetical protein